MGRAKQKQPDRGPGFSSVVLPSLHEGLFLYVEDAKNLHRFTVEKRIGRQVLASWEWRERQEPDQKPVPWERYAGQVSLNGSSRSVTFLPGSTSHGLPTVHCIPGDPSESEVRLNTYLWVGVERETPETPYEPQIIGPVNWIGVFRPRAVADARISATRNESS